ncbi:MAG: undecaprenyl-diphosphate phosphatase [Desulfonatronovibrionaceae bacterium]
MNLLQALVFGLVQGLTEFLPVSSSAHVIIAGQIMGVSFPGLGFEIFLHLASLLAVCLYFRKDLTEVVAGFSAYVLYRNPSCKTSFYFGLYILTATFITAAAGLWLESILAGTMKSMMFISAALCLTGFFLILVERIRKCGQRMSQDMKFSDSVAVGLAQTLAVLPGISRSGATLICALWIGLSRETAVRYSFLLSIPIIAGSSGLMLLEAARSPEFLPPALPLASAFAASFVFSWIGIVWLIDFLKKSRLVYFALYCFTAAFLIQLL